MPEAAAGEKEEPEAATPNIIHQSKVDTSAVRQDVDVQVEEQAVPKANEADKDGSN